MKCVVGQYWKGGESKDATEQKVQLEKKRMLKHAADTNSHDVSTQDRGARFPI